MPMRVWVVAMVCAQHDKEVLLRQALKPMVAHVPHNLLALKQRNNPINVASVNSPKQPTL
jgi:hypothetical protein